jgi:hypothetical protein
MPVMTCGSFDKFTKSAEAKGEGFDFEEVDWHDIKAPAAKPEITIKNIARFFITISRFLGFFSSQPETPVLNSKDADGVNGQNGFYKKQRSAIVSSPLGVRQLSMDVTDFE